MTAKVHKSLAEITEKLRLDKSSASRRVSKAIGEGFLVNSAPRAGKPLRVSLGKPLPDEIEILPAPEMLDPLSRCAQPDSSQAPIEAFWTGSWPVLHHCGVQGEDAHSPSPSAGDADPGHIGSNATPEA